MRSNRDRPLGTVLQLVRSTTGRPAETIRVAFVTESFLPDINGVTNSVLHTTAELTARGHECVIVAPGPGPDEHVGVPVIRVASCDIPHYGDMRIGLPTARLVQILRRLNPDVVHLAAPTVLGAAGGWAARRLDIPTVAVFQTDLAGFAQRRRMGLVAGPIWRWLRRIHNQADVTLAPSTSAAWMLREQGIAQVAVWGRGVDLERFDPAKRSRALHDLLAPDGRTLVGYVGRLAAEKQVERLLRVERLPGVQVVVVGDGPARRALRSTLARSTFLGLRHGEALAELFASLDVFVHTGLDETFCQAIQEALASGVPVVAPAAGGPLDLVRHGVNGFLWDPRAPASLAGAVSELATSPTRRDALARAARPSVEHRPWSGLTDELLDHYHRVIVPHRARMAA